MTQYTQEQIYGAMREADKAGDGDAVRALAQLLKEGASKDQINAAAADKGLQLNQEQLDANIASRDAGGPTSTVLPPTAGEQLAQATAVTAKGAAKAAASPLDLLNNAAAGLQTGIAYGVTELPAMALDAFGADGVANSLRGAGQARIDDIERARSTLSIRENLDQAYQTPKGLDGVEFASELVAGLAIPFGPKSAPRIQAPKNALADATETSRGVIAGASDVIEEGVKRNVPVLTTDIKPPQSGIGRYIKQTLPEKIPFAGTSGTRQAQQVARQRGVADLVDEFGGNSGRELFDTTTAAAEDVSRILTRDRGEKLARLSTVKNAVIDRVSAPFTNAPNTVRAISEQIRELRGIDAQEFAPVIERLQRFGDALTSGKTLRQVEEQRKLLGELFADGNLAQVKKRGQQAINKIYEPLRQDMGNFISANAGTGARTRWSQANEELATMVGELKSARFKNVLRDSETSPETISRILFSASSKSDMQRLVSNLSPEGVQRVQAAMIQRAFDTAGGAQGVSVERFLNNLGRMSDNIGIAFKGKDRRALEGAQRLLEATRRASEAGANVRTGEQNLPTLLGIGATQTLGFTGGIASLGVGGLLARVYESPTIRNRLVRLATAKKGSTQERRLLQGIMREASPIVHNWQDNIVGAINDNPAGRLAAEGHQPEE